MLSGHLDVLGDATKPALTASGNKGSRTSTMERMDKKRIEIAYLEQARRASSIFPSGPIPPDHECPDFQFHTPTGTLGIELTLLCREEALAESGRLAKVTPRAQELYCQRPDAPPVHVYPVFHPRDAETLKSSELARSLAEFVYSHRREDASFEWNEVPEGFYYIGVHQADDCLNEWHWNRTGDTVIAPHDFVANRIAAKDRLLPTYRQRASELWLLLVNDGYLGVGELYVTSETLARWTFESNFDKVLLFDRPLGGPGTVTELRRTTCAQAGR